MWWAAAAVWALAALAGGAHAHAQLHSPRPWSTAPSKSAPCGGFTKLPVAAVWVAGAAVQIQWQLIAGDGAGSVKLTLDPFGSSNPPGSAGALAPITFAPATSGADLRVYNFAYTVPAVTCATDGCTLQVASAGWVGCATVQVISASSPTPSQPNATFACEPPQTAGLSFCEFMNNTYVQIPNGTTLGQVDAAAQATYSADLANSNVFAQPSSSDCETRYHEYVCFAALPRCGYGNGVCRDTCEAMVAACGLQPSHAGLYNCTAHATSQCTNSADPPPTDVPPTTPAPTATPTPSASERARPLGRWSAGVATWLAFMVASLW